MFTHIKTDDFDEMTEVQEGWDARHRPLRTDRFEAQLTIGGLGGIQVDVEHWSTALELTGTSPVQGLNFALPLLPSGDYFSEGLEVTPDRVDVIGPGREIHAVTKQQASLISCSIPIDALNDGSDSPLTMLLAEHSTGHKVVRSTRQATDDMRGWWLKLLKLFAEDSIPSDAYQRLHDETLLVIARALTARSENCRPKAPQRYFLALRARDYMLERQTDPPSIIELCTILGVSERVLHYAFTGTFGVSPKRFLKARRMFAVHQALKSAAAGESVSDIAMCLGFWDLGYFARDYRGMFGELPSITLQRQRV